MEFWIVYDIETGAELYAGSGSTGTAAYQTVPEGAALIVVPQAVVATNPRDLDALRAALIVGVDATAEDVRQRILTPGAGQALAYSMKLAEARMVLSGGDDPTPFLTAEAEARGITVAELAGQVADAAARWAQAGAAIEAARARAKRALFQAATLGGLIQAARVAWPDVTTSEKDDERHG
ncbi:hypothetical protein [Sphingomonas sp.]|uniref:hypothetical protein n=1 Tax=Sphingomonas sp. TaxID=28214 RepID=UPI0031D6EAA2